MRTVAVDLGVRKLSYCEVRDGQVVARATLRSVAELEAYVGPTTPPAVVVFEACREAWHVHDVLVGWGQTPVVIDTTRVRQLGIGAHGRKTDRVDAEVLARAIARGGVPTAHVLSPARRELRAALAVRAALVATRAQYVTAVRGLARSVGVRLAPCAVEAFADVARAAALPDATRAVMAPLLALLDALAPQVAAAEAALAALCQQEPVVTRLATVRGVGLVTAAAFVSVIDTAGRFRDAHAVEAYLGLVPSERSSGQSRRLGAITKRGNAYARAMLVEAARCVLRGDPADPLTAWGQALAARRSHSNVAAVAVARRLAGILWALWRDGTTYDPAQLRRASHARDALHVPAPPAPDLARATEAPREPDPALAAAARKLYGSPRHASSTPGPTPRRARAAEVPSN